jgi:hypothetical protein
MSSTTRQSIPLRETPQHSDEEDFDDIQRDEAEGSDDEDKDEAPLLDSPEATLERLKSEIEKELNAANVRTAYDRTY